MCLSLKEINLENGVVAPPNSVILCEDFYSSISICIPLVAK